MQQSPHDAGWITSIFGNGEHFLSPHDILIAEVIKNYDIGFVEELEFLVKYFDIRGLLLSHCVLF